VVLLLKSLTFVDKMKIILQLNVMSKNISVLNSPCVLTRPTFLPQLL